MKTVLLAGGTGYLGGHIWQLLLQQGYRVRALVRNPDNVDPLIAHLSDVRTVEVTHPASLRDCCEGVDLVISTLGINRQQDGLRYRDVDYQANLNLLQEAQRSGVDCFVYVSVLNGELLRHLAICDAKEAFVDQLRLSGLNYRVIRPNGFFPELNEMLAMAQRGRIWLLGNGQQRYNPIHGEDLARMCVNAPFQPLLELPIGGPDTLTHQEIARLAFVAAGNSKPRISHIPVTAARVISWLLKHTTPESLHGPMLFFLTAMSMDMVAQEYGYRRIERYFEQHIEQRVE
ncbi:SDR family oxidoreductase [Oceanobacter antarcticus]|uniref:SDR family oxidoreductase n=1 Tax=Oceanobacter antarcticus TaxID=3133425 RepID=A0ABW8NNH9_9GAMM